MNRRTFLALSSAALAGRSLTAAEPTGDDWPQFRGPSRDGVWRETGVLQKFAGPELPIKWRVPVSNGYTGPTVAAGRVYLCDRLTEPEQQERVLCFDAATGKALWSHAYPCVYKGVAYSDGPRASVTIHQGRAYSFGAMGHLHCFDAATGKVLWKRACADEFQARVPTFGISSDPMIDENRVVVQFGGANGACVVAFDQKTGEERWRSLEDRAGYGAPIVIRQGGKRVLLVWTGEHLTGLDPATGKLLWDYAQKCTPEMDSIVTPLVQGDRVFLSCWFGGARMLRLKSDPLGVEELWVRRGPAERNTDGFHALFTNPLWLGDHLYGIDTYGELRCLDAKNGDRLWESQAIVPRGRNSGVHFVRNGDRLWIANEKGELIIARFSPKGYEELSRTRMLKPTLGQFNQRGGVVWSHPAFAYRHVFNRNDEELVCASLTA